MLRQNLLVAPSSLPPPQKNPPKEKNKNKTNKKEQNTWDLNHKSKIYYFDLNQSNWVLQVERSDCSGAEALERRCKSPGEEGLVWRRSPVESIEASKSVTESRQQFILLTMLCREKWSISCILLVHILALNTCCVWREKKILKEEKGCLKSDLTVRARILFR